MTFTKEQLREKLEHRITVAAKYPDVEEAQLDADIFKLALSALAGMEAEPSLHRWRRVTVEPYGPYQWHYGDFIGYSSPVDGLEDEYYYTAPHPLTTSERAELENYRNAEQVVPDERAAFESFMEKHLGDVVDRSRALNGDNEYMAWDMAVGLIAWQGRAAMQSGAVKDGWVAVHQEIPPQGEPLLICTSEGVVQRTVYGFDGENWLDWYELYDPVKTDRCDLWQPLPAAPQQEAVSSALEHGLTRYSGAMQKLADGGE